MENAKITVSVKYTVGYEMEIPKKVFKQLEKMQGEEIDVHTINSKYSDAIEWLSQNVEERDCYDLEYQVETINKIKSK